MRFVKGVTLTPQERHMAGYDRGGATSLLKEHRSDVTLADGRSCSVTYLRRGPTYHEFVFGPPLNRKSWSTTRLHNSPESIMTTAAELAGATFLSAQCGEQEAMRRKSKPKGWSDGLPEDSTRLRAQNAADLAGLYAVCVRMASGFLFACGPAHADPRTAVLERASGKYSHWHLSADQRLVIGICCRFARRWYEAAFVPLPAKAPAPETQDLAPSPEPPTVALPLP